MGNIHGIFADRPVVSAFGFEFSNIVKEDYHEKNIAPDFPL
jgi:hypothetical protein